MKRITFFLLIIVGLCSENCKGQTPGTDEFTLHTNGLIYSEADMKILGHIVDSLNLRFKTCELNKTYLSNPQGPVWYLHFSSTTNNLKAIKTDIESGKDFSFITEKYAGLLQSKDTSKLLIKTDEDEPSYLSGTPASGYRYVNQLTKKHFRSNNKWAVDYSGKDSYSETYDLYCWYLPALLKQSPIPAEYARLVQYVDCMIDTGAMVMLYNKSRDESDETTQTIDILNRYINRAMGLTRKDNKRIYDNLTIDKIVYAQKYLADDPWFVQLVEKAVDESIASNTGNESLEELADGLVSKTKVLEMMRRRRVMGMCSQDQSPRIHALNIALLAAETHSWNIFLRAHMDIMNDRFARMSDGNYAWGSRKTYLKELEELGLNVVDLMLGLTLRAANVADNHYYGTVWRIGWALSESKDRLIFEERVLQMMQDIQLDEFNRGLLCILYKSYLDHLPDQQEKLKKVNALKADVFRFPESLQGSIAGLQEQ